MKEKTGGKAKKDRGIGDSSALSFCCQSPMEWIQKDLPEPHIEVFCLECGDLRSSYIP